MKSVADLNREIREFINRTPRKSYALLHNAATWYMLCSCLDTIDDTELAIDAHASSSASSEPGEAYLFVYGVLQALFIQQDAVKNLCQALNIEYKSDPLLGRIREIRNDSIGHPTKRDKERDKKRDKKGDKKHNKKCDRNVLFTYNFVSRADLNKDSFRLSTEYSDGRPSSSEVFHIAPIIESQKAVLHQVLSTVLDKLKHEEAEHRAEYRKSQLQDAFPATLGYYFQKIYQAVHGSSPVNMGGYHIGLVADVIEAFRARLKERGIVDPYDYVSYQIGLLEHPILRLKAYFEDPAGGTMTAEDAFVFVFFTEKHLDELRVMAAQIDATYDTEP